MGTRMAAALVAAAALAGVEGRRAMAQTYSYPPAARASYPARPAAAPVQTYQRHYAAPAQRPVAAPAPAAASSYDGSWFLSWLNATRARYGLPAVGYDPNLASWAAANSAAQTRLGLGHHVMGPARRQNSAMGGAGSLASMWMNSPAHRAALLDPSIRWIGLAGVGAYWTFNAR